jgi:hypothetical protein
MFSVIGPASAQKATAGVASVIAGGTANGWAIACSRYSVDCVADEDAARRKRIDMWSGDFEMRWGLRAAPELLIRLST